MRYFLYDTETTGLFSRDEVIQFSGYYLDEKFRLISVVNFYSYTQVNIHPDAYKTHRIDKQLLHKLSGDKTFEENIFSNNCEFIFNEKDITFIGYNIGFDNRIVNNTLKNNGFDVIDFGTKITTLTEKTGRHFFDLMIPLGVLLNNGIKMKLKDASTKLRTMTISEVDTMYESIYKKYGIPKNEYTRTLDRDSLNKFHNSLYDSFIYWCLLSDYIVEINTKFRM